MDSTERMVIILASTGVFITVFIILGVSMGLSFGEAKTILTLLGLAMTFAVSTEQIVRWTNGGSPETLSRKEDRESENYQGDTSETSETTSDQQSVYSSYERDRQWREYPDGAYKSARRVSKLANRIGAIVYQTPIFTKRRVWTGIAFVMFLGLAGFLISLSEYLVMVGFEAEFWKNIATAFSIGPIESNPTMAVIGTFFLTLLPLGYLLLKQKMTCENCGTEFSLKSLGRFYHGEWGKEAVPITDEDGNRVGRYHEYEGYRILDCEACGRQYEQESEWNGEEEYF